MSESPSPKPAMEAEDRASPERSASPKAAVEEGRQDALAGMVSWARKQGSPMILYR
jgi:hypothetical protein